MGEISMTLTAMFTPAFHELLNTAEAIKERHGPERAIAWAHAAMELDFDLFCKIGTERKAMLRLIRGGRA